jgi:hypothetical protein
VATYISVAGDHVHNDHIGRQLSLFSPLHISQCSHHHLNPLLTIPTWSIRYHGSEHFAFCVPAVYLDTCVVLELTQLYCSQQPIGAAPRRIPIYPLCTLVGIKTVISPFGDHGRLLKQRSSSTWTRNCHQCQGRSRLGLRGRSHRELPCRSGYHIITHLTFHKPGSRHTTHQSGHRST